MTRLAATFVQTGRPFRGVAYRYAKRILIDPEHPILRIEHLLTNTGTKPIDTDQYCHNFLCFDGAPPGPDYVVTLPFAPQPDREAPALRIEGKSITLREVLAKPAYCRFKGQAPSEPGHRFTVRNKANGLSLTIAGDFPMSAFAYYADAMALSPEPFCALHVKPGETRRWARSYTFAVGTR